MTFIEVFDALNGKRITGFDLKDGTQYRCEPLLVDYASGSTVLAHAWIDVHDDGLLLHFNSRDAAVNMQAETIRVFDIDRVF